MSCVEDGVSQPNTRLQLGYGDINDDDDRVMMMMMMFRRLRRDPGPGQAGVGVQEVTWPRISGSGEAAEDEGGPGPP